MGNSERKKGFTPRKFLLVYLKVLTLFLIFEYLFLIILNIERKM